MPAFNADEPVARYSHGAGPGRVRFLARNGRYFMQGEWPLSPNSRLTVRLAERPLYVESIPIPRRARRWRRNGDAVYR
jgi:hypothetical protein